MVKPIWNSAVLLSSAVSQSDLRPFPAYYTTSKRQKSFTLVVRVPSFERDRPPGVGRWLHPS